MNVKSVLEIENHTEYSVVRFFGFVDAATVESIKPVVSEKLSKDCPAIIVDLTRVDFIDSHGVGFFVSLLKKVHSRRGRLIFVGAIDQPASVLNMVGFNTALVTYCDDMQKSLSYIAGQEL